MSSDDSLGGVVGVGVRVSKRGFEIVHAKVDSRASEYCYTRVAYAIVFSSMPKLVYNLNIEKAISFCLTGDCY